MLCLKCVKKNKGALTVEAAISLHCLFAYFEHSFLYEVAYIHNNVQYAINGAANELSTYSYLYSVSGFRLNDEISEKPVSTGKVHRTYDRNFGGF